MIYLAIVTTLSIGMLIGTEFAVSVFVGPILAKLENGTRAVAIRMFATRLGRAMPFWYFASQVLLLAEVVIHRHEESETLLIAACCIWATVIVFTIAILVPINNRMMRLDGESFSEESRREHRLWEMLHHVRVFALMVAMVCFLLVCFR
jgi:uncharacterized membrane protein